MNDIHPRPNQEVRCSACQGLFIVFEEKLPKYCPFCKSRLHSQKTDDGETSLVGSIAEEESVTLIAEHTPDAEKIQFSIGPYQILESIGKGGMGEVYLAYDTICGRQIALKRIRPDLISHQQLHNRFLKEARITSQLTHPGIIPIYAIQNDENLSYYTMPFVEGETLKLVLNKAKMEMRKGIKSELQSCTIPALIRIFLTICQAIAYAHSKKVLHRDIKPDNIIVGRYGQVLILDWGLAKITDDSDEKTDESLLNGGLEIEHSPVQELTRIGKVVGTVAYMAPERALGQPATYETDIYSLGVILYQILTLRHPFRRGTIKEFRANISHEVLQNPAKIAPYRDVPPVLSRIALKCLAPVVKERYKTVDELIHDIESYIEGRSEWFKIAELNINTKSDWEFQENVLIAEHMAITRATEVSDWVSLMISKASFAENTKVEAKVRIVNNGEGLGFLLSVPEAAQRVHLNNGYCLWLGSDLNKSTKLLRTTVEVLQAPEIYLKRNEWVQVRIEKIDNNIHFYLNDTLQFSYISHLPLTGTHLGLLSRDADFEIKDFFVSIGSQNIKVNCLAVPDAFLAHKDYATALSEYRRIGYAFPGTAEGREGMFRAGVTLLEEARNSIDPEHSTKYEEALDEFSKLHGTPGAPLEYLGKALVYQVLKDYEEEAKCFELANRRYSNHPLLPVLQEQLIYRMHESSRLYRIAAYDFILLAVRYLPSESLDNSNARDLFNSLKKHWEPLFFIENGEPSNMLSERLQDLNFAIALAFWVAKPYVLAEIIDEILVTEGVNIPVIGNALYCLVELGSIALAQRKLDEIYLKMPKVSEDNSHTFNLIKAAIVCHQSSWGEGLKELSQCISTQPGKQEMRIILHFMEQALVQGKTSFVHDIASRLEQSHLPLESSLNIDCCLIWSYLLDQNWNAAGKLLHRYSLEQLSQETTPLHFLYGCWLYVTEGGEIAVVHFSSILETAYPRSWTLFSHFINSKSEVKTKWLRNAFLWEKRQLYRQLALFYSCVRDIEKTQHYKNLEKQEYLDLK